MSRNFQRNQIQAKERKKKLTLQEPRPKVDTHVGIPSLDAALGGGDGDALGLDLLELLEDAVLGAEPDDDLGHAEQEGLDPELHELALKVVHVAVVADRGARLELDPVGRRSRDHGLGVPDLFFVSSVDSYDILFFFWDSCRREYKEGKAYLRPPHHRYKEWSCQVPCVPRSSTGPCCSRLHCRGFR
jgi:hypothetical protein